MFDKTGTDITIPQASLNLDEDTPYFAHLLARSYMQKRDYLSAHATLHKILIDQQIIPEPMLYFVFSDFEICCREIGDFKGAYESSNNKMTLIQKLLA